MVSITPGSRLASLLEGRTANRPEQASAQALPRAAGTPSRQTKEQSMVARIRSISTNDPQRHRKAYRIFLESTLLDALSPALLNDPEFYSMVDHILAQIECDQELTEMMGVAADYLLKLAHRGHTAGPLGTGSTAPADIRFQNQSKI